MALGFTKFIAIYPSLLEKSVNLFADKGRVPAKLGRSAARESAWPRALEPALPATPSPFSAAGGMLHSPFAGRSLSTGKIITAWLAREG